MSIVSIRELIDNGEFDAALPLLQHLSGIDKIEGLVLESWVWESK